MREKPKAALTDQELAILQIAASIPTSKTAKDTIDNYLELQTDKKRLTDQNLAILQMAASMPTSKTAKDIVDNYLALQQEIAERVAREARSREIYCK